MTLINAIPSSGEIALTDETQIDNVRNAYDALTLDQQALVTNESVLMQAENELISLELATNKVVIAENSISQTDVDDAQIYVSALTNGSSKTALQDRLDAVQDNIDVLEAETLINNYFASNSVEVSRYTTANKEAAFISEAEDLINDLGATMSITNTVRNSQTISTYTIVLSKGNTSVTLDVTVTFVRN
ncbi:hypothetical protein KHQ89_02020 [Mycoplasmatota bacterium]|nr:hypothetical protein KHQ89_02020 [Mycoplasmatota bacterium]